MNPLVQILIALAAIGVFILSITLAVLAVERYTDEWFR